jgi:hypothetical protein
MAQLTENKLLKRFDQNVEITGTLTLGEVVVSPSSYLTSIPSEYLTQTEGDARYLQSVPSEYLTQTEGDARYLQSLPSHTHDYLPLSGGTITGALTLTGGGSINLLTLSGSSPTLAFTDVTSGADDFYIHVNSNNFYILRDTGGVGTYGDWDSPHPLQLEADTGNAYVYGNTIITSGNIGSQSVNYASSAGSATSASSASTVTGTQLGATAHGLTAFTSAAAWSKPAGYQTMVRADQTTGDPGGQSYYGYTITSRRDTGGGYSALLTGYANNDFWITYNGTNSSYPTWRRIWTDINDGSGSGLDADLLDGVQGSSFVRSDAADTITGDILINTGNTQNGIRFRTTSGDFVGRYSNYVSLYNQTSTNEIRIYDAGYIQLDGTVRAPIVYDSNNTAYYSDPASTSNLNTVTAIDFQSTSRQTSPRWDTAFYVLQAQHWYGDNNTQTMYVGEDNYIHLRDNVEVTDDIRSPIYYDRNDTTYYTDPAGTSRMNVVNSRNDVVDDEVLFAITDYDTSESIQAKFGGGSITKIDDPDAPASGVFKVAGSFNPTFGPYMPMDDETEVIFECWAKHDSGSDTAGLFYAGSNFYDGNKSYYGNTQRYWGASYDAQDANDTGWRHIKGAFKGSSIRAALADASYFQFIVLFNYQSNGNTTRFCGFKYYRSKKTVSSLRVKRGSNDTGFQTTEAATSHQVIDNNGNISPYDALSMPYYNGGTMYLRTNSHWDSISGIDAIGGAGEFRFSSNTGNLNVRTDGWLIAHDYVQSLNQVYGTIYYDQNNTGYYVDPSSNSKIYNLELISAKHTYLYINPGNGYEAMVRFNGGSGSTWYVGSRTSSDLIGSTDAWHVYSQTAGRTVSGTDTAGNVFAYGSVRAPIFYDYNNTGYYCNPASTSLLSELNANHFGINNSNDSTRDGISLYGGYSSGEPTYGLLFTGTSLGTHGSVTGSWATYFTMNNDNSRGWIFRRVGSGNSASISAGGVATFDSSVRSPIFYDSNDTGYYINPASTSYVNYINSLNGYLCNSEKGIVGNYDSAGTADKIIWTIGNSWNSLSNHYGIGYDYNSATYGHHLVFRNNGTAYSRIAFAGNGAYFAGTVTASGDVVAYSDERIKENIETIDNALDIVKDLRGVRYDKIDTKEKGIGVIAQEVEKVLPEVVKEHQQDGMKTVAYGNIVGVLIEAIKEQQKQIDELKKLINH